MNNIVDLPTVEPIYSTYNFQTSGTAILANNPSIRNWYLNHVMILTCKRGFLSGRTTPDLELKNSNWTQNPHLDKIWYDMRFLKGYINVAIKNFLDQGYYVYYMGIDDYYVEGKSWYQEKHFDHDGLICGYNRKDKTYCIYSYDQNWINQKFWTSQKGFERGRKSIFERGNYGVICGLKPKKDQIDFHPHTALNTIAEYLDSSMEKYPEDGEGVVNGIVVQEYLAKYIDKLYDGSIPYERKDRRIFRLIWEHKKVMHERIQCIEKAMEMDSSISQKYASLVEAADSMRMLYASHQLKRRDSLLPIIRNKLLRLRENEEKILKELILKTGGLEKK